MLDEFRTDPERAHLKEYTDLIYNSPVYPVILDSKNQVLSLPPVINGSLSKISVHTKNVFVECTACDLTKAHVVLDIMVTMFSQYCGEKYSIETVKVNYKDGMLNTAAKVGANDFEITPKLETRNIEVKLEEVKSILGLSDLSAEKCCEYLNKMQLVAKRSEKSNHVLIVTVPPMRADILHPVDVIEDVAIGYGFNSIPESLPVSRVPGKELPVNQMSDLLRYEIASAGFIEILTFGLCSKSNVFGDYGREDDGAVILSNPKTAEYEVVRTSLVPGLLKTLQEHKSEQFSQGLKLFEISDVVLLDATSDTGTFVCTVLLF